MKLLGHVYLHQTCNHCFFLFLKIFIDAKITASTCFRKWSTYKLGGLLISSFCSGDAELWQQLQTCKMMSQIKFILHKQKLFMKVLTFDYLFSLWKTFQLIQTLTDMQLPIKVDCQDRKLQLCKVMNSYAILQIKHTFSLKNNINYEYLFQQLFNKIK